MYKIIANKKQLESIGISRDISNILINKIIKKYRTGYVRISVEPEEEIKNILGNKAVNEEYDIPINYLEEIK